MCDGDIPICLLVVLPALQCSTSLQLSLVADGKSCCHELCRCLVWANQRVGCVASAGPEVSADGGVGCTGPGRSARKTG